MIIYGLKDPITNNIRYIGKTKMSMRRRLQAHIDESRKSGGTYKKNWIRKLLKENLKPEIILICNTTNEKWQEDEKFYISTLTNLTNTAEGGLCGGVTFSTISSYDLNGVYIKTYDSIIQACEELNYERGMINSALQRYLKNENNIGGNYLWVYETNDVPKKYIKPYVNRQLTPTRIVDLKTKERKCFESIDEGLEFFKIKRVGNVFRCIKNGIPYKNRYSIVLLK